MLKLFFKIICCCTLLGFFFPPAKASEPPRPDQLKILLDSAHLNFKKLKIEEGLHYATLAENMALELSDSASLLEIHLLKANLFFEKRNILKAEEEYVKTERLAAEQKDTLKLIKAISGQANILTFQGESLKALVLSYKAKEIAVDFDKEAYIGVLANMSNSLVKLGQYDNALKILVETRDHFEKTGNDRSLGIVYNNIGELYREHLKNFELAKEHYLKAIKLNKKIQDQFQLSMNYGNLGINYKGAGQLDSALYFLQLSQSLKEKIGDKGGLAVTHYNTGEAYLEVGDYKKPSGIMKKPCKYRKKTASLWVSSIRIRGWERPG